LCTLYVTHTSSKSHETLSIADVPSANSFLTKLWLQIFKKNWFYSSEQFYLIRITYHMDVWTDFEICPIKRYTLRSVTDNCLVTGILTLCTFVWVCLVNCILVTFCFSTCLSICPNTSTRKGKEMFCNASSWECC
jgi:hypothetical protein